MTDYFMGKTEEEAINKGMENVPVEFNGDDFCDEICGWDGESRRCDCGNRRVYWATEQYEDGTWTAWGEAW